MSGPSSPKRIRLSAENTLSLVPTNQTPVFKAPNEVIDKIFTYIIDPVAKMKLELVCERFRWRVRQPTSWNNELKLEYDGQHLIINGVQFSKEKALNAFKALLDRINVHRVIIGEMPGEIGHFNNKDELLICLCSQVISHKDFFMLKRVSVELKEFPMFDGNADGEHIHFLRHLGTGAFLNTLAKCDLSCLETLEFTSYGTGPAFELAFLPFVMTCENLKRFSVSYFDRIPLLAGLEIGPYLMALEHCEKLQDIRFYIEGSGGTLSIEHIDTLASLCNSLTHLKGLNCAVPMENPERFVQKLSEDRKSKIEKLGLYFNSPNRIDSHFIRQVSDHFPKLKKLILDSRVVFKKVLTKEVIENVVKNFSKRGPYTFELELKLKLEDTNEVLTKIQEYGATVLLENGLHKCSFKDKFELILDLD